MSSRRRGRLARRARLSLCLGLAAAIVLTITVVGRIAFWNSWPPQVARELAILLGLFFSSIVFPGLFAVAAGLALIGLGLGIAAVVAGRRAGAASSPAWLAGVPVNLLVLAVGVAIVVLRPAAIDPHKRTEDEVKARADLDTIGMFYLGYMDAHGNRGPANLAQLKPEMLQIDDGNHSLAKLVERIEQGRYVVVWNGNYDQIQAVSFATVLAYESDVPTKGGWVCLADRHVRRMTAQEFQAAPKADAAR
jgi:hypothetical protein